MESVCRLEVVAGKSVFVLFSSTAELSAFLEHQQPYWKNLLCILYSSLLLREIAVVTKFLMPYCNVCVCVCLHMHAHTCVRPTLLNKPACLLPSKVDTSYVLNTYLNTMIIGICNYNIFFRPKAKAMGWIELALTWTQLTVLATYLHGCEFACCSTGMMECSWRTSTTSSSSTTSASSSSTSATSSHNYRDVMQALPQ